jgi:serine/threonine protein kinase, bacterial
MSGDGQGTPFGRYRLIELLGRGGMGEVWRAYDPVNERFVALKVLPDTFADDAVFQERFRREARAASGLDEPHVVPIYDSGEIDGRLFVSMRLVRGRELQELLGAGALPPARVVGIIEQVASALHAAHEVGLVHRDVKPSNILIAADDFAYLIDFGIARAAGEAGLTSAGSTIGTWAYMAPERFTDARVADARVDIYALACVLHQALTGRQPFPADGIEQVAMAHMMEPPPRPSRLQAGVPEAMDEVIAIGMAKDPRQRYVTTKDLARAARTALHAAPRRPEPPPTRAAPPPSRPAPQYTPPPTPRPPITPSPTPVRAALEPATLLASPATPPPQPVPTVAQWAPSPPAHVPAEPRGTSGSAPVKPLRRRRGLILASVAVTVAVVIGVVTLVLTDRHKTSGPELVLPFTGLNHPGGVAVDGNGAVYVVDSGNNRLLSLAAGSRDQTVRGFTDLNLPHGVAVDSSGVVYVADTGNERVLKLDGSGAQTVLPFIGLTAPQGVAVDGNGAVYVTDSDGRRVLALAAGSSEQAVLAFTDLARPDGVAVDSSGSVYVTDVGDGNHRVVKLDAASGAQTVLPFTGLNNPSGVAVDGGGAVYVADRDNHRVVKLDVGSGAQTVLPFTGLKGPYGVVVDGIGDVYVTDNGNNRVIKLPHR